MSGRIETVTKKDKTSKFSKNEISSASSAGVDIGEDASFLTGDYYDTRNLPRLFVYADVMPETKDNVNCAIEYFGSSGIVKCFGKIKCQGTSSMSYDKKNYTLSLYKNNERTIPFNKEFKNGWGLHSKYCLKANYIDHSHMRNILSANLWSKIVESRSDYNSLPDLIKKSYNHCAIDGFPFKMYVNGKYAGLYTWNIPKDDWLFSMDSNNPDHIALCAESNSHGQTVATACNFKKLWDGIDGSDWSIEVGSNSEELVESVNNVIGFVKDSTNEEFVSGINEYFDLTNLIDYYILVYFINALDNLGKNMIMFTYDKSKWYLSPYDLDSTYGNFYDGRSLVSPEYACPQDYEEAYNRLFERICDLFPVELKNRYFYLRESVLNPKAIVFFGEQFYESIGKDMYDQDLVINPGIPNAQNNNVWQIESYISERQAYADEKFSALRERIPCTRIELPDSAISVPIGTPIPPYYYTKYPENTTDRVFYSSSNEEIFTVDDYGYITGTHTGDAIITVKCGEHSDTARVSVSGGVYDKTIISLEDRGGGWYENDDPTELAYPGAAFCFTDLTTSGEVDIFMLDENEERIGIKAFYGYNGEIFIPDDQVKYIYVHLNDPSAAHSSVTLLSGGDELTNSSMSWFAGIIDSSTGIVTEDATSHTWFSNIRINCNDVYTIASRCISDSANYNYKGVVVYNWVNSEYLETIGSDNAYRDDYEETSSLEHGYYKLMLTATDMDLDTKSPLNKVRIFNFNKNALSN